MQENVMHYSLLRKICKNYYFYYKTVVYNLLHQSLPYGLKFNTSVY